jgi:hypothetical protein
MAHAPEEPTLGECLDALKTAQRRELLYGLLVRTSQEDGPVQIDVDESDEAEGRRRLRLQHVHLPKLEENEFITWDRDADVVSKGPHFEEITPLLELLVGQESDLLQADELPHEWL